MSSDLIEDIMNNEADEPEEVELELDDMIKPKPKAKRVLTEEQKEKLRANLKKASAVRKENALKKKAEKELEKQRLKEIKQQQKEQAKQYAQGILNGAKASVKTKKQEPESESESEYDSESYTDEEEVPITKPSKKTNKKKTVRPNKASLKEQARLDKMESMLAQIAEAQKKVLSKPVNKKDDSLKKTLLKLF